MYLDARNFGVGQSLGTRDSDLIGDVRIDDLKINPSRWFVRGDIYLSGIGYESFAIYYYGKNMDSADLSRVTINSISAYSDNYGSYSISDIEFSAQDTLDKTIYEQQVDLLSGKDIIYGTKFDDTLLFWWR